MTERQRIALEMLKSGGMSLVHTSTGKQTENILKALDFADHFIAITENEENVRDVYRDHTKVFPA